MELTLQHLSSVFTGKTKLLKDLDTATVLAIHPLLNAQGFDYCDVQKTKPIKARPINTILDKTDGETSVWEKLLLATLEGAQDLKRDAFICWGIADDVWQQTLKKLKDQYTIADTDEDGWQTWEPKPESPRNGYEVVAANHNFGPDGGYAVINPNWGDKRVVDRETLDLAGVDPEASGLNPEGDKFIVNLHYGVDGDWTLQRKEDLTDTYRVAKSFFDNTHDIV